MPLIGDVGGSLEQEERLFLPLKTWGEQADRSMAWEAVTAMTLLHAGMDILVMRHPEAVKRQKHRRLDEGEQLWNKEE